MLKTIVGGLLVIFLGAFAMHIIRNVPTYILISVGDTDIEFTLWAGLFFLLLLWLAVKLIKKFIAPFFASISLFKQSREKSLERKTQRSLLHFIEEDWGVAKKSLISIAKSHKTPGFHYLAAAHSAREMGAIEEAKFLLDQVSDDNSDIQFAKRLEKVRLALKMVDVRKAEALLSEFTPSELRQSAVLKLRVDIYSLNDKWDALVAILPDIKKAQMYSDKAYKELALNAYLALLQNVGKSEADETQLLHAWQKVPKEMKKMTAIVGMYCTQLHKIGSDEKAEAIIRSTLSENWNASLVDLYGCLELQDVDKQIAIAESWLKKHPDDAMLNATLGKLCMKQSLWGKARDYMLKSIDISPSAEVYASLGLLLAQLGEEEKSRDVFKEGLLRHRHLRLGSPE